MARAYHLKFSRSAKRPLSVLSKSIMLYGMDTAHHQALPSAKLFLRNHLP